jgi:transposase-like protein
MNDNFTAEANAAWKNIPTWVQQELLSKVWCPHCRKSTTMNEFGGEVEREDLVLRGRCASCGGEIARVVEGGYHSSHSENKDYKP